MSNLNDFRERFALGHASASPFLHQGLIYCVTCKMDVDHDTESRHRGTIYVYRRRCKRCGGIVARGVYDNIPLLNGPMRPERQQAEVWTKEHGEDRR